VGRLEDADVTFIFVKLCMGHIFEIFEHGLDGDFGRRVKKVFSSILFGVLLVGDFHHPLLFWVLNHVASSVHAEIEPMFRAVLKSAHLKKVPSSNLGGNAANH
jgi:hypothetical protein